MSAWQPIETAPKDGTSVLLFGRPDDVEGISFNRPIPLSGYWDQIDTAWCSTTATWLGPFIAATHWQPLPENPVEER